MTNPIREFSGEHRFLSNFWPAPVALYTLEYPTVEHAYQAAKTLDPTWHECICRCPTPGGAKRLGRRVPLRSDWDSVKEVVMLRLLRQKFRPRTEASRLLLGTGDAHLEEGNTWSDTYWGTCSGRGLNRLGILLMMVREELFANEKRKAHD